MPKISELMDIFNAALAAVDPYRAVLNSARLEQNFLHLGTKIYDLKNYSRIVVVGAGKATARMAMAMETLLAGRISAGLIIVKEGHKAALNIIQQIEAAHPLPNQAGMDGTQKILEMARQADEETLLICLLSGGASALLVAPAAEVTLADKHAVTGLLLGAGACIGELNTVRKHLSAVKGGRLAQAAFPAQIVTLILSDVIGDPLGVIASGPTVADASTYAEVWAVIAKYQLQKKLPTRVTHHLQQGMAGNISETLKQGDACLYRVHNVIIGNNMLALEAAKKKALQLGIDTEIFKTDLQGEARDAARFLALTARTTLDKMQLHERRCLLSGGETTVTVRGSGMGGRNQELALAFAIETKGLHGVSLLSAGTDGSDGANDAAGAIVSGDTAAHAARLNIELNQYLANNDSYRFFHEFDAATGAQSHVITGPTGTNVMDMQIMLLEKQCA